MKHRSRVAWALLAVDVALLAFATFLRVARGANVGAYSFDAVTLGFGTVGAVVAARTANRVGWLFLAEATVIALGVMLQEYAHPGGIALPLQAWGGWLFTIVISGSWPPLIIALLVFPDGAYISRRWRAVAWASAAAAVVGMVCAALADVNFTANFPQLRDPVMLVAAKMLNGPYNASLGLETLLFPVAAASLIVRLVRSRDERRLQLKWFVYATIVAAVAIAVAAQILPDPSVAFSVFAPLIPIAAGVAIFKYRLYEIDVVINKTVVYGLLAAFITAVYVAIVVGIGALIGQGSRPNLALSILATAVVALAFQPVRSRVQRLANRLVYGNRATPYEVLAEFSARVATAGAAEEQVPRMARTLAEGTGASSATVWLGRNGDLRPAASWPPDAVSAIAAEPTIALPVLHHGEQLGALSLTKSPGERLTPAEERLARDLASQAGLVLHNVRLTDELRERLEELRASRRRLVAAQDAARRRLERNIHDGAQQQLVALSVKTNLARKLAARDPAKALAIVDALRAETERAIRELDELASGIVPTALSELGLVEALRAQAARAAVPVKVDAADGLDVPPGAAAAIYFSVLEALQNVAKYANASHAAVRIAREDGAVRFEVGDDGCGFDVARAAHGTGLRGIVDRLASAGGTLNIRSAPGQGTTLTGMVPVRDAAVSQTLERV